MRKSIRRKKLGFTLLEVLISIIILMTALVMIGTHISNIQKITESTYSSTTMNRISTPLADDFFRTSKNPTGKGNVQFNAEGTPLTASNSTRPRPDIPTGTTGSRWDWNASIINQKTIGANFTMVLVSDKKGRVAAFAKPTKK